LHACPDQGWLTSGLWYLNCDSCLKETRVWTGYHIIRTVESIFPYLNLERIWSWLSTDRRPDVLLSWSDGCKLDRNFSTQCRVRTEMYVVRTDDAWSDWRPDSMARHPDREPKSSIFHAVQSLLRVLWKVESLFTTSLHTQVILSRMRQKYQQTPPLAILTQKSLDRFEIHSQSKHKNYSPIFVTKGQRVKQSNKNQL